MNFFGDPIHIQTKQFVILCTLGIYRHVQPQPPKKKSYPKYIINQKICNIWNMIDYLYFFQVEMFQACFRHAQSSQPKQQICNTFLGMTIVMICCIQDRLWAFPHTIVLKIQFIVLLKEQAAYNSFTKDPNAQVSYVLLVSIEALMIFLS